MEKYDSNEELYFSWYLEELHHLGVIKEYYYHPKPFHLSDKQEHAYEVEMKTKSKVKKCIFLNDHEYQADFIIYWSPEWENCIFANLSRHDNLKQIPFIANKEKNFSVIDVKGTFIGNHNTTAITFPLNQKWVYQQYKIYVQKIVPEFLFKATFTPRRFLTTNKSGARREIKWKPVMVDKYLLSIAKSKNVKESYPIIEPINNPNNI